MVWIAKCLGEVLTFQRGFDITKADQNYGPYRVISSSGPNSRHDQFKVKGPGVVIGRKGSLGTTFYSYEDFWPHDTTLWIKEFHGNDARFAYYFVQTMGFEKFDVGASNPTLNRNHIHLLQVRWPDSLITQRHIASILSAYDDLIENNTQRIAILEEMARRIYEEWFVRFRFPGHEGVRMVESELGLVPEGWKPTQLDELYRTASGGTPSRDHGEYFGGDINWVKTKELNDGFIFDTEEKITELGLAKSSAKVFPKGSVLIAMYGATIGQLGILSVPAATNQACCAVVPKNPIYSTAYGFLTLVVRRQELIDLRAGAAQQNINQITIRKFQMLAAPSAVMAKFNHVVEPLLALLECLQKKNQNLRTTRDLLLPKLISGELDVSKLPDPEAVAA